MLKLGFIVSFSFFLFVYFHLLISISCLGIHIGWMKKGAKMYSIIPWKSSIILHLM